MTNQVLNTISTKMKLLQFETKEWLKEAQLYLDQIEVFQRLVQDKNLPNHGGEQISRDVNFNLRTMANKILKEIVNPLEIHEAFLKSCNRDNVITTEEAYVNRHGVLAILVKNLKASVLDLKVQVQTFIHQKEFGVRTSTPQNKY
ncbi:hypothetical protein [Flavimarina sp. Hel_I_48]|uniref:hypothetical protein n=1 Tax=Flavimarina sp. Hel_I_48 TaxID=1392488 RepID=UPI0013DB8D6C|nr:hypothetical protein [Flavimarina sp. Hel_I_48]